ncbi:hypothetical protein HHK36_028723 [Tetracentron sinense]|uniref:Photolyase/cryptochrome alpha/beta domain-containing protein n=1 Tax=Tetracentron sinense TaxID=13715 RepID=A0A834YHW8_TETSI|nr:hypothetical protein HHK36_028723 [Tetracentron sinense]
MALLVSPRVLSFSSTSSSYCSSRDTRRRFFSVAAMATSERRERTKKEESRVAVVWFKHDLRIDDHLGLVAASQYQRVVPLYVFDHRILSRFSDEMLELVLFALEDLRKLLKDQGSNLMVRFGSAENVILELVKEVKATNIFAEEEVEYTLRRMIDIVEDTLSTTVPFPQGSPQIVLWQTPFYDFKNLKELPASYRDFRKLQLPVTSLLEPPILPGVHVELDWGTVPSFDDVKRYMNGNPCKSNERWTLIKEASAKTILRKGHISRFETPNDLIEGLEVSNSGESNGANLNSNQTQRKILENSVFVSREGNLVGGGTDVVLNALAAYLRYLEGTTRNDWQEYYSSFGLARLYDRVHEKLRNAEDRSGASFGALFGSALCLGIISRRRIYYEAIKYERERNAGFLSPFGYSAATVAAAADTVCSMEWYWRMALKSQKSNEGSYSVRIWKWNGYLIQYSVVGHEGPAILLVHGFGAFMEHYRDNMYGIADGGNRVWAITLLGFGKSEKPNIMYTELMWAELLRDFIIDVVGEPAHLVGNSIGGYFVALVAGLWPALVKSVVLINTAGSVIQGYSSVPVTELFIVFKFLYINAQAGIDVCNMFQERRISGVAWLGGRLLLLYLRLRVGNLVKNCYPANTQRADDWLIDEMIRASNDPGVLVVLESVFNFNLSIPLNQLLEIFEGKVLIIQGMRDPISNSELKLSMLREHCSGVVVRELDAGHCPHDERPEEVNFIIREWIVTSERNLHSLLLKASI